MSIVGKDQLDVLARREVGGKCPVISNLNVNLACHAKVGGRVHPRSVQSEDFQITYPAYISNIGDSQLDNAGYSPSEQATIAANGIIYVDLGRLWTTNGTAQVAAMKALNPDLIVIAYDKIWHRELVVPRVGRPYAQDKIGAYAAFGYDQVAIHADLTTYIRAWPAPPSPTLMYWYHALPAQAPYSYFRELLDAIVAVFRSYYENQEIKPDSVMFDYIQRWQDGHYIWPDDLSAYGYQDSNKDGVTYPNDAVEQAAFKDYSEDYIEAFNLVTGGKLACVPNGRGPLFSGYWYELMSLCSGVLYENAPFLPWGQTVGEFLDMLLVTYNGYYRKTHGRRWSILWGQEVSTIATTGKYTTVQCLRIASMIFEVFWTTSVGNQHGILDDGIGAGYAAQAGAPLGPPTKTDFGGGVLQYQRVFEGGVAQILVFNNLPLSTWTPT